MDPFVFQGRTYPIHLQFRFVTEVFPKCPRRNPCAGCYKRGSWWK